MTKIIGLTGGIGSGKSTVANIFAENDIPIYIADDESKKILDEKETIDEIVSFFSTSILSENGKIDKSILAKVVFNDKDKLNKLNEIMHSKVKKHFESWLESKKDSDFIIKETALLFEYGLDKSCYKVITVTAPIEIRIERAMLRDNVDEKSILDRIKNQLPDSEKIINSDFVINNISLNDTKVSTLHILNILQNETRG